MIVIFLRYDYFERCHFTVWLLLSVVTFTAWLFLSVVTLRHDFFWALSLYGMTFLSVVTLRHDFFERFNHFLIVFSFHLSRVSSPLYLFRCPKQLVTFAFPLYGIHAPPPPVKSYFTMYSTDHSNLITQIHLSYLFFFETSL